jgi:hypothetical protein
MTVRSFSSSLDDNTGNRSIDNDAPAGLRQKFIDVVYLVFERLHNFDERRLHNIIIQSLGFQPGGTPYGGFRYAIGRDVLEAPWERFYDLIIRLVAELPGISVAPEYRLLVNRLLASYRVAWELGDDNELHRVLPVAVAGQVEAAFRELSQPRFEASLTSFRQGISAYDARPQRGKDACKNVFDALEGVAKSVGCMPNGTFGDVLKDIKKNNFLANETITSLQKLYELANNHFRHGMTEPFGLKPAEVDYVLVSCVGAILLFIRI